MAEFKRLTKEEMLPRMAYTIHETMLANYLEEAYKEIDRLNNTLEDCPGHSESFKIFDLKRRIKELEKIIKFYESKWDE